MKKIVSVLQGLLSSGLIQKFNFQICIKSEVAFLDPKINLNVLSGYFNCNIGSLDIPVRMNMAITSSKETLNKEIFNY